MTLSQKETKSAPYQARRGALAHLVVWTLALLTVTALWFETQHEAQHAQQSAEQTARRELANLTRLGQEHAERTLLAADQKIKLIRLLYLRQSPAFDLASLVRLGNFSDESVAGLGILDAQGRLRHSRSATTEPVDWSDQAYFQAHRKNPDDVLVLSPPGRAEPNIRLSRRINHADGSFAGVVVLALKSTYFSRFYAEMDLGKTGSCALLGTDGTILARRTPASEQSLALPNSRAVALIARGEQSGFFENQSPIDQVLRLHHFRRVKAFPVFIQMALGVPEYRAASVNKVREDWREMAIESALALLLAAVFSWHHWHKQRSHEALAVRYTQMNLALDGGGLGLWEWDISTGQFKGDVRLLNILGLQASDRQFNNALFTQRLHPDDRARLRALLLPVLKGESMRLLFDHRLKHQDGHWICLMARGQVIERDAAGRALRLAGTDVDRTQQKQVEEAQRIAAVAFACGAAMSISDAQQTILQVNQAFVALSGYSVAEAVGQSTQLLRSGRHPADFYASMWADIKAHGHWAGELWNRRKDGEVFLDWLAVTSVKDAEGATTHYVSVHSDITLRKRSEEEIRQLAFYDPLTQLPNRRLLLDRLGQLCAACARNGQISAILFIDLDHFKELNDSHGHDQGDDLLLQVAQRLLACVREVDTVGRLGGDEFIVALAQLGDHSNAAQCSAQAVAQKILATLADPFVLPNLSWQLSASIGIALLQHAKQLPEDILKKADLAMYAAKAAGRNAIHLAQTEVSAPL